VKILALRLSQIRFVLVDAGLARLRPLFTIGIAVLCVAVCAVPSLGVV
jgi:hypothetical protein